MGFLDDAKKKLGDAVDKHGDKINQGLDKAGNHIDQKTGGKYREKIDTGVGKAKEALDGLDDKRDDLPQSGPSSSTPRAPSASNEPSSDPVPPTPGINPNEDIAAGTRPIPAKGDGQ